MAHAISKPMHMATPIGVLRGLSNAGDPLVMLGTLLREYTAQPTHRWIIDNRAVDSQLRPDDYATFLDCLTHSAGPLDEIAVAWVGSKAWGSITAALPDSVTMRMQIFDEIADARSWLQDLE